MAALFMATFSVSMAKAPGHQKLHNILFILMDDVGIDQLTSFGYGGLTPPPMPILDQIAKSGVRFRNNWSMSAC